MMITKVIAAAFLLVLGSCPARAAPCLGDGGIACPGQDPIVPVQDGYDAANVDWNAVVADVYAITEAEPRVCTMVIRAWFHDVAAHQGDLKHQHIMDLFPGIAGSDGSILTDVNEVEIEHSAHHGFVRVVRHVLVQLAATHGASHADTLTVFAATCPDRLAKSTVSIPQHCEAAGFPLFVGKYDYRRPDHHPNYQIDRARSANLFQAHTRIPSIYGRFLNDFNKITEPGWALNQRDITALMGAHGVTFGQNCMTDGEMPEGANPSMSDRTCAGAGGNQRMFSWSNHYWLDVSSGTCFQIKQESGGRAFTEIEDGEFTSCSWNSMEGFELGEIYECHAMRKATQRINTEISTGVAHEFEKGHFATGWREGKWTPDPENPPAPCCGHTCQTCEEDIGSKFWCGGDVRNEDRYWPYGYFDCDWSGAYRNGGTYCDAQNSVGALCEQFFPGRPNEIRGLLNNVKPILDDYRNSASLWEEEYAVAFCKMANVGANYTANKISLGSVFSGPSSGCLNPAAVLSPKECPNCQINGRNPDMMTASAIPSVPVPPPSPPPTAPTNDSVPEETQSDIIEEPEVTAEAPASPVLEPVAPPPPTPAPEPTPEPVPPPPPAALGCTGLCAWLQHFGRVG